MVFWYNPDPEVDKMNVPKLKLGQKEISDCLLYGERPYVIVSSDEVCFRSPVIQICPIHSDPKEIHLFDVVYNSQSDRVSVIKVEQIRTVNSFELTKYHHTLNDDIIKKIDRALAGLLGIQPVEKEVPKYVVSDPSYAINEALTTCSENLIDRIKEMIETKPDILVQPVEPLQPISMSQEHKPTENAEAASIAESTTKRKKHIVMVRPKKKMRNIIPIRKPGERHDWTEEEIKQFYSDYAKYDMESVMHKYGCESRKQVYDLSHRLSTKLK